jgi:hypothetical protein
MCLNWRTRYRAVGTEHATIALFRPEHRATAGAFIKEATGIGRHGFRFCGHAVRAGDDGFKDHGMSLKPYNRYPNGLFGPVMRAKAQARLELDAELRRAFADKEFVLHFQLQLRLSDGAVVGAEALLRWQHRTRGILGPGAFIERGTLPNGPISSRNRALSCRNKRGWLSEPVLWFDQSSVERPSSPSPIARRAAMRPDCRRRIPFHVVSDATIAPVR